MIYSLLWQFNYGQVHVIVGMLITPGSYELPDVMDKALVSCLGSCSENLIFTFLFSVLLSKCPYLHLVMLQACFISQVSACDGRCARAREMHWLQLPEVSLAVSSSHFPDQPALPIKSAAADCRACHRYQFCLFITQSAWLFCSIKLTPIRKCSVGVVWLLPLLFPSY